MHVLANYRLIPSILHTLPHQTRWQKLLHLPTRTHIRSKTRAYSADRREGLLDTEDHYPTGRSTSIQSDHCHQHPRVITNTRLVAQGRLLLRWLWSEALPRVWYIRDCQSSPSSRRHVPTTKTTRCLPHRPWPLWPPWPTSGGWCRRAGGGQGMTKSEGRMTSE